MPKWWIRSFIQDYILRNWSIVRTGSTSAQKQLFFNLRRLRSQLASVTTDILEPEDRAKIAGILHVSIRDVENYGKSTCLVMIYL
jgi:RNA polymerase sigma-32 factor